MNGCTCSHPKTKHRGLFGEPHSGECKVDGCGCRGPLYKGDCDDCGGPIYSGTVTQGKKWCGNCAHRRER